MVVIMDEQQTTPLRPIVLKMGKKKKRKYSRGLGDLQRAGRGMSKVSMRLSRSMFKGANAFRKASDKSARKKRDGALRDFGLNMGKAASKSLRASSRVPRDLGKLFNMRSTRKIVRRQIRITSRMNRMMGLR